jgi:predicted AlkP superfamily pyrophosphatase or phosphodiesterase
LQVAGVSRQRYDETPRHGLVTPGGQLGGSDGGPMSRTTRAVAFLAVLLAAAPAPGAEPAKRVVMISVDGLMPDYYQRADALGLRIPHLRRLMREGAWARVRGVLPSVTYPSHTTLITGVPPRVHGIGSNTYFDPEERSNGAWRWYASEVRVPTLVSAARARGLPTGSVSWPVSVGRFADQNLPEFFRGSSTHPSDLHLVEAMATPGLVAAAAAGRGRPFAWPFTDAERTDVAVHIVKHHKPSLLLLHIFDLDHEEHEYGPMTPEAKRAVEASDAHIGRVLAAIEEAGLAGETLVAIVSDHGFLPVEKALRPNALLREAGLLEVDEKGKIKSWQAAFQSSGGTAALRLNEGTPAAVVARVRALLEPRLADAAGGLRGMLDPDAVRALGGEDAALLLNAREGFVFQNSAAGEWLGPTTARGTHGHVPDRDELHASLILAGPGFARRGELGVVPMTRIAPTLARVLGIQLGAEADQPLH